MSEWTPSQLIEAGWRAENANQLKEARDIYHYILQKFPQTNEANAARQGINRLERQNATAVKKTSTNTAQVTVQDEEVLVSTESQSSEQPQTSSDNARPANGTAGQNETGNTVQSAMQPSHDQTSVHAQEGRPTEQGPNNATHRDQNQTTQSVVQADQQNEVYRQSGQIPVSGNTAATGAVAQRRGVADSKTYAQTASRAAQAQHQSHQHAPSGAVSKLTSKLKPKPRRTSDVPDEPGFQTEYHTGRGVSRLMSFIGWLFIVASALIVAMGYLDQSSVGGTPMVLVLGAALAIAALGLILVVFGQAARAIFDNANATGEILHIIKMERPDSQPSKPDQLH